MTKDMNSLVPTSIVDKNGKQTTVHKKLLTGNGTGAGNLPAPGASGQKQSNSIDWNNTSSKDAIQMAKDVNLTLSDPTHLWDNFEFYTGMLNSPHNLEARALIEKHEVLGKLRDAWLDMHGMVLDVDRDKYSKIKGPNGYNAFTKARDKFLEGNFNAKNEKRHYSHAEGQGSESYETALSALNPFNGLLKRRERKEREEAQRENVRAALVYASPYAEEPVDIMASLKRPEMMSKASKLVDVISGAKGDVDTVDNLRNFAIALLHDDDDHTLLTTMSGHSEYIESKPAHLPLLVQTADYLKNRGTDYQQPDGRMPHLEGYVETLSASLVKNFKFMDEDADGKINVKLRPHIERAVREYDRQRVQGI